MTRLTNTIACDARLQFRNGFYYAALFVGVLVIAVLFQFREYNFSMLIPLFMLSNMLVSTFYFVAGLILLERDEHTLSAQIVTPLTTGEYILAKIVSLGLLAVLENTLIIVIPFGIDFHLGLFLVASMLTAVIYILMGIIVVIRYASINEFLFPGVAVTIVLSIPLFNAFELVPPFYLALHPVGALLELFMQAVHGIKTSLWLYLGILLLWIVVLWKWAEQRFSHFVRAQGGA